MARSRFVAASSTCFRPATSSPRASSSSATWSNRCGGSTRPRSDPPARRINCRSFRCGNGSTMTRRWYRSSTSWALPAVSASSSRSTSRSRSRRARFASNSTPATAMPPPAATSSRRHPTRRFSTGPTSRHAPPGRRGWKSWPSARRLTSATWPASRRWNSAAESTTGLPRSASCASGATRSCSSRTATAAPSARSRFFGNTRSSPFPSKTSRTRMRSPCSSRSARCRAASGFPMPRSRSTRKPTSSKKSARPSEKRQNLAKTFLSDLRDLKVGDLVVHVDHGIGEFVGLKQLGVRGAGDAQQEFLELRYSGEDKLFVPVERLDLVQKYTGGARPALDRLGGTTWEKAKTRVKKAMRDMAEELLKLYAQRKAVPGHAFGTDTHWQEEFEDAFPYELTVDQADRDYRHQARHGDADADGSAALRRRRLRQDRSGDARRVQGGDGRQAGGVSRADHGARVPAPEDTARSLRRLSCHDRHGQPVPHEAGNQGDARRARRRQGGHHRRHAPAAVQGRRLSAISACSSSTRSSGSAWRTRSASSRCARRSTS